MALISNSDYQAGPALGTFGNRVQRSNTHLLWHKPTDWAKSLWLSSFTSDWTAAVFRDLDKLRCRPWCVTFLCNTVHSHALSCTELAFRHSMVTHLEFGVANKDKKRKLAIYKVWPWISNCWEWDPNSGCSGLESSTLTTGPRRLGANLHCNATSSLLSLNQSVLADFDDRKKNTGFKTCLSGTSKNCTSKQVKFHHSSTLTAFISLTTLITSPFSGSITQIITTYKHANKICVTIKVVYNKDKPKQN